MFLQIAKPELIGLYLGYRKRKDKNDRARKQPRIGKRKTPLDGSGVIEVKQQNDDAT
jgi:hypothetical protein